VTPAATITLDLTHPWQLTNTSSTAPAQVAYTELQQHWPLLTGHPLSTTPQSASSPAKTIRLAVADQGHDGFTWQASADQIQITGASPRGLLFGVYHFLEAVGCRWLAPGELWTRLPRVTQVSLPSTPVSEQPAFAGRCLIIGHYAFGIDVNQWIIWAARNRYNTIFLHTIHNDIGGGAMPWWAWERQRDGAMRLLRERGMTIELGGHGLPDLLPRRLFKTMPEAFRQVDGRRVKQHNFCPSSPQAQQLVRENARTYFIANPGIDVYHLWADDIPGGGWCSCPACAGLSSSDQLLVATNLVAAVLAEVAPKAELSFIAYLDTEDPPTQVTPLPNVCLLWAPRTRNYGRAIADPTCPVNVPYYPATLQRQGDYFRQAGTLRVFEYYSDAILFKSVLPILTTVMQQDLRYYHHAGVHTIQTLMTGDHPWVTAQLTNWLFGRLTWQPDADVTALVVDFCQAAFGAAGAPMAQYYAALEQAYALLLHQTPDQRGHGTLPGSPLALIREPVADMEDPVHATPATLQARAAQVDTLLALVDAAAAALAQARQQAASPQLQAEATAFALTKAWLHFGGHRLRLYAALATQPPDPAARHHWQAARQAAHVATTWAKQTLSPLFQANFRLMHMAMWELRLRRIQADHFTPPPLRWWVDLGTLVQLASRYLPVVRAFKAAKRR